MVRRDLAIRYPQVDGGLCRGFIRSYEAARYGPGEVDEVPLAFPSAPTPTHAAHPKRQQPVARAPSEG